VAVAASIIAAVRPHTPPPITIVLMPVASRLVASPAWGELAPARGAASGISRTVHR
jgi:hypothetical protein